jgi:pimeloyl-ACP methyl ester carboxylesterase
MSWFEHSPDRIYYEYDGTGETVLVLPGWGGSIEEFALIRKSLTAHFRVIAPTFPVRVAPNHSRATTHPPTTTRTPRPSSRCSRTRTRARRTSSDSATAARSRC